MLLIFLPLVFLAGVFGINVEELRNGPPVKMVLRCCFTIVKTRKLHKLHMEKAVALMLY